MSDNDGARFSPQPTKSKCTCAVIGCPSKAWKDLTLRFHSFPRSGVDYIFLPNQSGEVEKFCRRDVWAQRLLMGNRSTTDNTRICSLHFKRSDYILPNITTQKRYLKKDAIPSCNLPFIENVKEENENSMETLTTKPKVLKSYGNRNKGKSAANQLLQKQSLLAQDPEHVVVKTEPLDEEMTESLQQIFTGVSDFNNIAIKEEEIEIKDEPVVHGETSLNSNCPRLWDPSSSVVSTGSEVNRNAATQTERQLSVSKLMNVLKTNRDLNILTGIPNFSVLGAIVDVVEVVSPRLTRVEGLSLGIEDRIIMTFMKLKQDLHYGALSAIFKCRSKRSCKRIIIQTLEIMSRALKPAIRWPGKNEACADLARSSDDLTGVRSVINRLEIAVRRPKELSQRVATFSRYKRYYSVKFMTAITPAGSICFLSKAYGGRTSHKTLFEESNIVGLLEKNEALMALKDFPIDEICTKNDIKLVKSLYKRTESKNQNPADYRVRLNVNRRIRRFRIFRRKLTTTLSSKTDQILTILCALENLHLLNPTMTTLTTS